MHVTLMDVGKLREDSAGSVAALDDDAGAEADAADVCSVQAPVSSSSETETTSLAKISEISESARSSPRRSNKGC